MFDSEELRLVGRRALQFYSETLVARADGAVFAPRHATQEWESLSTEELKKFVDSGLAERLTREEMIDLLRYRRDGTSGSLAHPDANLEGRRREDMALVSSTLRQFGLEIEQATEGLLPSRSFQNFWDGLLVSHYVKGRRKPRPKSLMLQAALLGIKKSEVDRWVQTALSDMELRVGENITEGEWKEKKEKSRNSGTLSGGFALGTLAGDRHASQELQNAEQGQGS